MFSCSEFSLTLKLVNVGSFYLNYSISHLPILNQPKKVYSDFYFSFYFPFSIFNFFSSLRISFKYKWRHMENLCYFCILDLYSFIFIIFVFIFVFYCVATAMLWKFLCVDCTFIFKIICIPRIVRIGPIDHNFLITEKWHNSHKRKNWYKISSCSSENVCSTAKFPASRVLRFRIQIGNGQLHTTNLHNTLFQSANTETETDLKPEKNIRRPTKSVKIQTCNINDWKNVQCNNMKNFPSFSLWGCI